MFKFLVLGLLREHSALHGYAIMKACRERTGIPIASGNFYRELQKLTAAGHVRMADNRDGDDPRRAPYAITEQGTIALRRWLGDPARATYGPYHDELSTRALLVGTKDRDLSVRGLNLWQSELRHLEGLLESALLGAQRDPGPSQTRSLILRRCLEHTRVDLEFVRELRRLGDDRVVSLPLASVRAPRGSALAS